METTTLNSRPLGHTGMQISTVGFGAWAAGGPGQMGWGPQDDRDSIAAIHRAVEHGVTWVDTAAVYGFGHSEQVVGQALAQLPQNEQPWVFTKCGLVWDTNDVEHQDLSPDSIRRECDASLQRLGLDHIDLYQIHAPDPNGPPIEESWQTMQELVAAGKVSHVGLSNVDVDLLERCAAVGPVASLQPPLSLINRNSGADVIGWCRDHGAGVIIYSPMESGLLTGRFTRQRAENLPEGDWRSRGAGARGSEFHEPRLSANLALQDALRPVAERHGVSVAAVAIAWAVAWPGVTGAIVGGRNPEQVDGWVDAANLALDADDLTEIRAALERTGAGHGPLDAA